jgi:hypothetical protein
LVFGIVSTKLGRRRTLPAAGTVRTVLEGVLSASFVEGTQGIRKTFDVSCRKGCSINPRSYYQITSSSSSRWISNGLFFEKFFSLRKCQLYNSAFRSCFKLTNRHDQLNLTSQMGGCNAQNSHPSIQLHNSELIGILPFNPNIPQFPHPTYSVLPIQYHTIPDRTRPDPKRTVPYPSYTPYHKLQTLQQYAIGRLNSLIVVPFIVSNPHVKCIVPNALTLQAFSSQSRNSR